MLYGLSLLNRGKKDYRLMWERAEGHVHSRHKYTKQRPRKAMLVMTRSETIATKEEEKNKPTL